MSSLPLGVRRDRARGALLGLAIGDALGMPTEGMSPEEIRSRFGVIDRFHARWSMRVWAAGCQPAG